MSDTAKTKIDPKLASRLRKMAQDEPNTRLLFIITLDQGADPQSLAAKGFQVEHIAFGSIVSGNATAAQALEIGTLSQVESVEEEIAGSMHMMDNEAS